MPVAYWCVLAAGLMPIVVVGFAKADGAFDNRNPRDWLAAQDGFRKRAHAAHLNCFEAFPLFAAGVAIASFQKAPQASLDLLAVAFLALRTGYVASYLADKPTARTLFWLAAAAATIALFVLAAFSGSS